VGLVRWVIGVSGLRIRVDTELEEEGGGVRQNLRGAGVRRERREPMIGLVCRTRLLREEGVSTLERVVESHE
jgi:hypothetical protein